MLFSYLKTGLVKYNFRGVMLWLQHVKEASLRGHFSSFANRATLPRITDHHQLLAHISTSPDGNEQFTNVLLDGVFRLGDEYS